VNPSIQFFVTSSTTGQGMSDWFSFLRERVERETKRLQALTT
jgi:hypothetical protein